MSERGVFGVDRGIWDHPLFDEPERKLSKREAWLWLISEAAFKPRRVKVGSIIVELQRGQLAHSLRYIAKSWGWTIAAVRHFLGALNRNTMISTASNTGLTIITVCNYDKYQVAGLPDDTANSTASNTPAARQQHKAEERKKEIIDGGDARAREAPTEKLTRELFAAIGVDQKNPELAGMAGLPHYAAMWVERGYDPALILATAADIAGKTGPPKPLKYYATAIENACTAPPGEPHATPRKFSNGSDQARAGRGRNYNLATAAVERARAAGAA